ncbi:YkvA family protein [Brucellaceae bacterium C25G]
MDDVKIGEILEPGDESTYQKRTTKVKNGFWKTMRRATQHIPFMDEVVAAYFCAFDPQTPLRVRMTLMAALAYFVLPFDFIPDMLVGIGFTDDIAVLMAALAAVRTHITPAHRAAARTAMRETSDATDTRHRP